MMKFGLIILAFVATLSLASADDTLCIKCHKQEIKLHEGNIHYKSWLAKSEGKYGCANCHGDGTIHAKMADPTKESIIGFGQKSPTKIEDQNRQCLNCHQNNKEVKFWHSGKHAIKEVSCASCHSDHTPTLQNIVRTKRDSCLDCHKDRKTELSKYSHHPIEEGKMFCSDCHNPHGTMTEKMLKFSEVTDLCTSCHTDKRGPFLWEHSPVQEDCLKCHTPHGGNHDKLLKKRAPALCQDCHNINGHQSVMPGDTDEFGGSGSNKHRLLGRACIECHTKIHGSHAPQDPSTSNRARGGKFFFR